MRFFKAFVLREEMINTLTRLQSSLSVSLLSGARVAMGRSARYAKTTGDESDDYIRTRLLLSWERGHHGPVPDFLLFLHSLTCRGP